MSTTLSTKLKLDIPATPETLDPELFKELVRVYNSLQLIAQLLDQIQVGDPLPPVATDLPTAIALLNAMRTLLAKVKISA